MPAARWLERPSCECWCHHWHSSLLEWKGQCVGYVLALFSVPFHAIIRRVRVNDPNGPCAIDHLQWDGWHGIVWGIVSISTEVSLALETPELIQIRQVIPISI